MRRALGAWLLVVAAWATPAEAITELSAVRATKIGSASVDSFAYAGAVSTGNLLCYVYESATSLASAPTDTLGTVYQRVLDTTGGYKQEIACGVAPSAGTPTLNYTLVTGDEYVLTLLAFTGTYTVGAVLDVDGGTLVTGSPTVTTIHDHAITTVAASTVVIGVIGTADGTATLTPNCAATPGNTGCTAVNESTNFLGTGQNVQTQIKVKTTAGAETISWTSSTATVGRHYVASFKEVAAAPAAGASIGLGIGPFIQ